MLSYYNTQALQIAPKLQERKEERYCFLEYFNHAYIGADREVAIDQVHRAGATALDVRD